MSVQRNGVNIIADHLLRIEIHETFIFPATTGLTCTMAAHATEHVWSEWAEIADSGATKLTAAFASKDGHIAGLIVEDCSEASQHYMFKIAYGGDKVVVGMWRILSESNKLPIGQSPRCRGIHVPAGETIYYSAMCETAGGKTATVHIRYFLED